MDIALVNYFKCKFLQVEEGVELFEEIRFKMQEANSENQREKFQVNAFHFYFIFLGTRFFVNLALFLIFMIF